MGSYVVVAPYSIGSIAYALIFADKINTEGRKYKCISFLDWLAARWGEHKGIRLVGAITMILGLIGATSAQVVVMSSF